MAETHLSGDVLRYRPDGTMKNDDGFALRYACLKPVEFRISRLDFSMHVWLSYGSNQWAWLEGRRPTCEGCQVILDRCLEEGWEVVWK